MKFKSKWGRALWRVAQFLGVLYLGLLLFVFFEQRKFIYHPGREANEFDVAKERGFQPWQNEAGRFIGWKQISNSKREHKQLLIVHGNAGSAVDRVDYADDLQKVEPFDVYILEYPGFGSREGTPSQDSLFRAADEAIALLKKEGPVYLVGESLGTGVAAYLAGAYSETVRGVLLIAPYDNLTHVAQNHMPIFPVRWMLLDRFPSDTCLKNYHGPIAMLFAGQDLVVPNRFGHQLFEGYQGPKKFWEMPQAGHEGLLTQSDEWWRELLLFWKSNPETSKSEASEKNAAIK